jgi:hypothetical protein
VSSMNTPKWRPDLSSIAKLTDLRGGILITANARFSCAAAK